MRFISVLFPLTVALGVPSQSQPTYLHDSGNTYLVNEDPYSVVNIELERAKFNAESDVVFRLFTRHNQQEGQVLKFTNYSSVQKSNFNSTHPTRFIIHGWNGDGNSELHGTIRRNYFTIGNFNVINVDWGKGAKTINYITARNRVSAVGKVISHMINTLVAASNISHSTINLIGHSLGAHIAGYAGKRQAGKIGTIVALDPAGPLFSSKQSDILSKKDAQYVEAVYTNSGALGFGKPLGDSNFYPNGGKSQPGCGVDLTGKCSHNRAHKLFAESLVTSVGFVATKCSSHSQASKGKCSSSGPNALMGGEPANRGISGFYRFSTKSKSPFAKG